jgi:very-short-patch-repair endonuclease/predicted transcriptional regulator of viral defense system
MQPQSRNHQAIRDGRGAVDAAIARLAARQHAVVSGAQLLELGLGYGAIKHRVNTGRLRRIRRGIYLVGPTLLPHSLEMAAILTCGPDTLLSHRTAAALHQLLPYPARSAPIDVTFPGWDRGRKSGIRIHRTSRLEPDEITSRQRIPVTTAARTILDLSAAFTPAALEQLVAQAHRKRLATAQALHTLIARYPRRPGTPALRALLASDTPPAFTRSSPERRLLTEIRKASLPEPEVNAPVAGLEVDFLWPEQRLVVEVDGYPFHSARPDRRRDQARDATLAALGHVVLRVDADDVGERAVAAIAAALARLSR